MALGFQVLAAARAAAQGATLQECKALAEKGRDHTGILFAVQTLEYLRRGGRIGGAAAFLGTVLDLKPLLELRNGRIEAVERVRTMNKAVDRLLDLFEDRVNHRSPVRIACVYSSSTEEARMLLERARQRFNPADVSEIMISPVSPVIGVHVGPNCMGLAYMAGM
jgi:DegV family protein with EDD domain